MKKNYLIYLLNELENDLLSYADNQKFKELYKLLSVLKKISEKGSYDELIKYTYVLLKTKQFEGLGSYLLFVIKKAEEEVINFENFNDNLTLDKGYLKNYFLTCFGIETENIQEEEKDFVKENTETILKNIEESQQVYETLESEFLNSKTESITEEMNISEESEKNDVHTVESLQEETTEEPGLTLIVQKDKNSTEEIYDLPKEEDAKKEKDKKKKEEQEIYSEDNLMSDREKPKTEDKKEEKENKTLTKKIYIDHFDEEFKDFKTETMANEIVEKKEDQEKIVEKYAGESEEFKKYETEIYQRNLIISEALGKIKETITKDEIVKILRVKEHETTQKKKGYKQLKKKEEKAVKLTFDEEEREREISNLLKNVEPLMKSIISECDYMVSYSREMSFEIITNIYATISALMKRVLEKIADKEKCFNLLTEENINLFINGIILIRKLVANEDYKSYETVVERIEEIRNKLIKEKEEEERKRRTEAEKKELEKKLSEKFPDLTQRRKLLILKEKILGIEGVFKSLDEIEGEYQIYNALRTLSRTFVYFKDVVKLSKELKIDKMAKLSESSYIFIKFIQNYRMDPLSKDIREILNYIVVNMKLLFLDKKTKDLDLFISYLNNPEKIFS